MLTYSQWNVDNFLKDKQSSISEDVVVVELYRFDNNETATIPFKNDDAVFDRIKQVLLMINPAIYSNALDEIQGLGHYIGIADDGLCVDITLAKLF